MRFKKASRKVVANNDMKETKEVLTMRANNYV